MKVTDLDLDSNLAEMSYSESRLQEMLKNRIDSESLWVTSLS